MRIRGKSYWIDFGNSAYIMKQKSFRRIVNICEANLIDYKICSEFLFTESGKKIIVTMEINKSWGPFIVTELGNLD